MATPIIQPTFTGGELSPSLYARVDLARYGTSLRRATNFIVRPYGGVVNRPGFGFIGEVKDSATRVRLLPFEFSTDVAYLMEVGDEYIRFIYRGAYVLAASSDAWLIGTAYAAGDLVTDGGIVYRSLQGTNIGHTPASSPTWWGPNPVAEVAYPWTEDELRELSITQSADVVYMCHPSHRPIEIRRLTPNSFEVREFANKNGPFAAINADESIKVAVSADTGNVVLTSNTAIFTADMVGSLFYVEEKDLRNQRPWEAGWRNPGLTALCRSDGKVYKCTATPAVPSGGWVQTGGIRPIHDSGRAYDGPQDTRSTGSTNYAVGVEWEYQHSGYGIVLITKFNSSTSVDAVVTLKIPASCVGGLGAAITTWNLTGDGVTKTFTITGAVSDSILDYNVMINGVFVQPNPYYAPPTGSGGGGTQDGGGGGPIYVP